MKKQNINMKNLGMIKETTITDVNYRIDKSGKDYIEICRGGKVEVKPYNEENRLEVMSLLKSGEHMAQDLSLYLATLELKIINYDFFVGFAIAGTAVSLIQNTPVTDEYGAMCALGGTVAVMVPAVLKTLTERKIEKIKMLSIPGIRRI